MGEWIFLAVLVALVAVGLFERQRRRRRLRDLGPGHDAHRGPAEGVSPQSNPNDYRYQAGMGGSDAH